MKDIKKLRQARIDKAAAGRAKTATYNTLLGKADRTAEETASLEAMGAELDALAAEVEALDLEIVAEESATRRTALFQAPAPAARTFGAGARTSEPNPVTSGGFKSMADFANSVRGVSAGVFDERLNAAGGSNPNQNNGSAGEGFLVPPDFSRTIWDIAFTQDDLLAMAAPEPTASNAVFKPKDESTPWGAAGVQAYWRNEAATMTPSKYSVSGELMTLHELYAFTAATNEVLNDAPMLENRLTFQAGRAIKWKASESIMWGTGAGQPLGFMSSPALIVVPKDSGQAAKTLSVNNLAVMISHVLRYGGKPLFICNPDILPQLIPLAIGNVPVWIPLNQGLQDSPWEGTILGYPVLFSEHAQTLGTQGDITCVNMFGYYAATKAQGGVEFASSMHLYFDTNETAFRWTFRLAGVPILAAPVQPAKGSTTKSHFVTLAAR